MQLEIFNIRLNKDNFQNDIKKINDFMDTVFVHQTKSKLIRTEKIAYWSIVVFYYKKDKIKLTKDDLLDGEREVYQALSEWRRDVAVDIQRPAFVVCHDSELIEIAQKRPKNQEELRKIKGWKNKKIKKYGDEVLAILNGFG